MNNSYKAARFSALAVLALLAALIVLEHLHTYSEPLERDITTYAVIGQELLQGRALYSDLWDHKPPAIHFTFALAEAVTGEGPLAVFLLNVLAALALLLGLYQAGKVYGGRAGGLWAALIWAVVGGDLYLQANQPNVELFLNAFQTWVFALWIASKPETFQAGRWILIGILSAIASLYKPFAFLEPLLFSATALAQNWDAPVSQKKIMKQAGLVFSCVFAAWMGMSGWFFMTGRWVDFKNAVWTYNVYYSGYQAFSLWDFLRNIGGQALPSPTLAWFLLLFTLGCVGAYFTAKKEGNHGPWLFWIAFLITTELEVLGPGHFFTHYDQLLFPPLILGGAGGIAWLSKLLEKKGWKGTWVPGAALLAFLVFLEAPFYRLTPEAWAQAQYQDGPLFMESYQLGREIDELLAPGETFYEWGNETGLYFAARRPPPSGVFYSYPLLGNPLAGELSQRVVRDLERTKPELIVLNTSYYVSNGLFQNHPVFQWIQGRYRLFPGNPYRKPFLLLLLKGGKLEKRLGKAKRSLAVSGKL